MNWPVGLFDTTVLAVYRFTSSHPEEPTTLLSAAGAKMVIRNLHWSEEPLEVSLLEAVQQMLTPVSDKDWNNV